MLTYEELLAELEPTKELSGEEAKALDMAFEELMGELKAEMEELNNEKS